MNICKRCGKENQEHYKFCLGCGGELTSSAPTAGAGPQKTIMAGALGVGALGGNVGGMPQPTPMPTPLGAPPRTTPTPPAGMAAQPGPSPLGPPPLGPPPQPQFGATPFPSSSPGPRGADPARTVMAGQMGSPMATPQAAPSPWGAPTPPPGGSPPFTPSGGSPQPGGYNPPPVFSQPPSPFTPPGMAPYSPPGGSPPFTPVSSQGGGGAPSFMPSSPSGATPVAAPGTGSAQHPAVASRPCPNCGTEVPTSFVFCGACGNRLEAVAGAPAFPTRQTGDLSGARVSAAPAVVPMPVAEPKPHGRLTLIRPDGSEGGTHELEDGENQIGRQHGALFENDGYLSPRHAEILISQNNAVIRDLGSLNGVFCKMTTEEELTQGDVMRIGQELLRYDTVPAPQPLEDGTEVMGSPNPGYWGRVSVIIGKDIDGSAYPLFGDAVTIGRERGDINFPDDGYVSGLHARISYRDGKAFVADLGSSNGTFIRLRGERTVQDGAFILFGQQLFRVNLMMV